MRALSDYIDELHSLDLNNIGSWPSWAHVAAIVLVSAAIIVVSGWYCVLPKRASLAKAQQTEHHLKKVFRAKQAQVANLDAYRKQLKQMQAEFREQLARLPDRAEVSGLLRDISQTRAENDLHEELFKPERAKKKGFYAILPNHLIVTGDYHDFAKFVSDVTALPRIVTVSGIHIKPIAATGHSPLRMSLTASTYRYLGKEDLLAEPEKSGS
jgi:type IV pilus assembly protein PilO